VAIKVLAKGRATSPEAIARFHREMAVVGQLIHPNIVTAYDAGEQAGVHYLVMEYVEGQDLARIVKQRGPLPVGQALQCILQAARGLAYAHEKGIVHRDIKPGNLLLDHKGTVKILDLGLARLGGPLGLGEDLEGERLTQSGQVMGTCDYMAPEQALDTHLADARSDIYSLGCTFYRLVVGRAPYKGDTLMQVLLAHREAAIPSLCSARPDVSPQVDAVFQKMVAKRPEDRYQSMAELAADLEALLGLRGPAGGQIESSDAVLAENLSFLLEAKPASAPLPLRERGRGEEAIRGWPPRKKWISIAAAAAGAAAIVFGILITLRDRQGKVVAKVDAPPGSQVTISPQGDVDVTLPQTSPLPSREKGRVEAEPVVGDTFAKEVAALPPEEQVARVMARLKELNPGVDGQNKHRTEGNDVRELEFSSGDITDLSPVGALKRLRSLVLSPSSPEQRSKLADLSPLAGLPLEKFWCFQNSVADLSPLEGMPLADLGCHYTKVSDLSPLKGMRLKNLNFRQTRVSDLTPLAGMPLEMVHCEGTKVRDLAALRGMPLKSLCAGRTLISDLAPLAGMSTLKQLQFFQTQVADLSPLAGLQLELLWCEETPVKDLAPLEGMPLRDLRCDVALARDPRNRAILLGIKTLQTINEMPAADFWKQPPASDPPEKGTGNRQ